MNKAYLLTGGNMGNTTAILRQAANKIEAECGEILQQSGLYETAAWGNTRQPSFINQALAIQTNYSAGDLMTRLLAIENEMGRVRIEKYGPRIIDIDILLFNEDIIATPLVRVPHPEMASRRFVLVPLAEIAPGEIHPVLHKTILELLSSCEDHLAVKKFS